MPASDYPELEGAPAPCTENPPWTAQPLEVAVPYKGYDDIVVTVRPTIDMDWPSAQYELFAGEGAYSNHAVGTSLGYGSEPEMIVWERLRDLALSLKYFAFGERQTRQLINDLGDEAYRALMANSDAYTTHAEEIKFAPRPTTGTSRGPGASKAFPLSVPDSEVASFADPNESEWALWSREWARRDIRDRYKRAVFLLWCASYGAGQVQSFEQNKRAWEEQQGGPGLATPGEEPPDLGPGISAPSAPPEPPGPGITPVPPSTEPPGPGGPSEPTWEPPPPPEPPEDGGPEFEPVPERKKTGGGIGTALLVGVAAAILLSKR